jgi:hypothetical protein
VGSGVGDDVGVGKEEGVGVGDGAGVPCSVGKGVSVVDGDGVGAGMCTMCSCGGRGPCRLENLIDWLERLLMANEYDPLPRTNGVTLILTHRCARSEPDRTYERVIAGRDLNVNLDSLHRLLAG